MALDDLLAKLERAAGTAGTAGVPADVPADPLQTLGGTAGTAGTVQNNKGQLDSCESQAIGIAPSTRASSWVLHFLDREPVEVWFSPAITHEEALAAYPDAVGTEPVPERTTCTAGDIKRDELLALVQAIYGHDTDQDRQEALADPGGALTCYRAIAAERGIEAGDRVPTSVRLAVRTQNAVIGCKTCRHRKRPGLSVGYCGGGCSDLLPAYGPGHPLRKLPDDLGAACNNYTLHED